MARFARYEFVQKIAVGGMAEVWAANAVTADGRATEVVVKRILPQFAGDESFQSMLLGEAEVTARLQHPNIVQVLDWGHLDETCFLAMERVVGLDGRQLLDACAMRKIPIPPAVGLFAAGEVLKALDHAHRRTDERGRPLAIVHRDVSPSNVLFSVSGQVKLTDFGIARAKIRASHTAVGQVRGKPRYMSPEQARGQEVDGRSDLFSVGLVLHELLTGQPVFPATGFLDEVLAVIEKGIPPPSQVNPALPPEIDALVLSLCERDLAKRPKTGAAACEAIVQWARRHDVKLSTAAVAELVTSIVRPTASAKPVHATGATKIMRLEDVDGVARFATQPADAPAVRLSAAPPKPLAPAESGLPSTRLMAAPVSSDAVPARRTAERAKETVVGPPPEITGSASQEPAGGADLETTGTVPAAGAREPTDPAPTARQPADPRVETDRVDPRAGGTATRKTRPPRRAGGETLGLVGVIAVVVVAVGGAAYWRFGRTGGEITTSASPEPTLQLVFDTPAGATATPPGPVDAERDPDPEPDPDPVTASAGRTPVPSGTRATTPAPTRKLTADATPVPPPTKRPRPTATAAVAARTATPAPTPIPPGKGFLTVRAKPNGEITVDGQWLGSTPLTKHELPSGVHTVDVTSEDGRKATQKVTILPDEVTNLSLKLE